MKNLNLVQPAPKTAFCSTTEYGTWKGRFRKAIPPSVSPWVVGGRALILVGPHNHLVFLPADAASLSASEFCAPARSCCGSMIDPTPVRSLTEQPQHRITTGNLVTEHLTGI